MKTVAFSPAAIADLDGIWDYGAAHWGPDQADRYIDGIRDTCHGLTSGAKRGRPVDIRAGYLKYAIGAHMIYFRDHGDQLHVIRILHQRQDVSLNLPGQLGAAGLSTTQVIRKLRGIPEVHALHTTNGNWDLVADIRASSLTDFDRVLREVRMIDGVSNSETSLLLSGV